MAPRASPKPMPPPRPRQAGFTHIIAETTAVEQEGFPPILGRLVRDVLRSPAMPGYVVFGVAPIHPPSSCHTILSIGIKAKALSYLGFTT